MYSTESYKEPFWAESSNFLRGRDPLGIQNSSISVYARLLPGMTNLTLRLRYYGMYLWLINEYHDLPDDHLLKSSATGQYNFFRRGELLIAYLMVNLYENELSIIGSDYAHKYKDDLLNNGYYNLKEGADLSYRDSDRGVYWAAKAGAIGQYYAGSLIAMDLMFTNSEGYFRTHEKGANLGAAYKESITKPIAKKFIECIISGKLTLEDIQELEPIALNQDIQNTPEGAFYNELLLSTDGEAFQKVNGEIPSQRKDTLERFLELLDRSDDISIWKSFPRIMYHQYLDGINENEVELGWYFYYLNELTHYSLETIFWGLLCEMGDGRYTVEQFLVYIGNEVESRLTSIYPAVSNNLNSFIQDEEKEIDTLALIDGISNIVKTKDSFEGITNGFLSLIGLYRDNQKHLDELTNYAINHRVNDKNGNALIVFQEYLIKFLELPIKETVIRVAQKVITEHIAVAYGKMASGEKNLLKFIVEEGYLVHIETMNPNFTNPRLRTLYNFTRDLNLLDEQNQLTEYGKEIVKK